MRKIRLPVSRIRGHLQNDGDGFENENASHKKQQHFLLDDHGDDAERAAERKRADITHENVSGMRVIPKEAHRSPDQRSAEDRQLARMGNVLNIQIACEAGVARQDK